MSATPTPRTDAAEAKHREWRNAIRTFQRDEVIKANAVANPAPDGWDFARKLETELAQLRADVRPLVKAFAATQQTVETPPFIETVWNAFMAFLAAHPEFKQNDHE